MGGVQKNSTVLVQYNRQTYRYSYSYVKASTTSTASTALRVPMASWASQAQQPLRALMWWTLQPKNWTKETAFVKPSQKQ